MNRLFRIITACTLGGLLTMSWLGCSESYDGPKRAKVHGKVAFNGTPVADGSITLIPDGHDGRSVSVSIIKGEYVIEEIDGPNLGKYNVEIYSFEPGPAGGEEEAVEEGSEKGSEIATKFANKQVMPAKFNSKTKLNLEISEAETQKDWDLTP